MAIFTGAGVAIVTPMNADGSVNFDKLGETIEYQIANKTDAIIICGTTGESSTLTHEEHLACIKYAVDKVAKEFQSLLEQVQTVLKQLFIFQQKLKNTE